jgi:hypothetical protein
MVGLVTVSAGDGVALDGSSTTLGDTGAVFDSEIGEGGTSCIEMGAMATVVFGTSGVCAMAGGVTALIAGEAGATGVELVLVGSTFGESIGVFHRGVILGEPFGGCMGSGLEGEPTGIKGGD